VALAFGLALLTMWPRRSADGRDRAHRFLSIYYEREQAENEKNIKKARKGQAGCAINGQPFRKDRMAR